MFREAMITKKTDPFRGDKMKLAIKSIETLVERVDNLYKGYSDKLVDKKSISPNNLDDSSVIYSSMFDDLKLFKGKLMPFQSRGLYWLANMYLNDLNGILADEMGLGKTIQIIAFICYVLEKTVSETRNILILVPLSVLPNWIIEFKRFAPKIPVMSFHGNALERKDLIQKYRKTQYTLLKQTMKPIIVTTYESLKQELKFFQSVSWDHLILDEAHRIKNAEVSLTAQLSTVTFNHCFLLTGTPFQNNLEELWSLLHFVFPKVFEKHQKMRWLVNAYDICEDEKIFENTEIKVAIRSLHKVLEHFMIRRIKVDVLNDLLVPKKEIDVYCGLSQLQMQLYNEMLHRRLKEPEKENQRQKGYVIESKRKRKSTVRFGVDYEYDEEVLPLNLRADETNKRVKLLSGKGKLIGENTDDTEYIQRCYGQCTFLRMKQVIDHPYLIVFPITPEKKFKMDERLITDSGKMIVLDKMLKKLRKQKHRVLIFSMTVMMMDLIEELMVYRNISYRRFDGSTGTEIRQEFIEEYNRDENIFAFLLSTKAGGIGINLTGADTVIFYDRSWNPQQDIQAQDRCHRIGQTKPVMVFTLVAKNTVDEKVINVATAKRRLEKIVIKNENSSRCPLVNSAETFAHLHKIFMDNIQQIDINQNELTDRMLDKILDRSELYEEIEKKKKEKKL